MGQQQDFDFGAFLGSFSADGGIVGLTVIRQSGARVEATHSRIEDDAAILTTANGEVTVPLLDVAEILVTSETQGPE